ncbi:hypothetical protein G9A89_013307 [Geosiphon pyriformis]|nr:hypothetical protein G9A89_013307 [Geosiphon pyriformis]
MNLQPTDSYNIQEKRPKTSGNNGLIFANQLLDYHGECFTWNTFRRWKRLDSKGSIPTWFVSVSNFIKCSGLNNNVVVASCPASGNVVCDTGFHGSIDVYTNGSIKDLGSIDACGGTAAYFPKADVSIGMRVLGLLSSILVKLQAIALALECVFDFSIVTLFMNNQTLLDIYKFEVGGFEFVGYVKKSQRTFRHYWNADFFANTVTLSKSVLSLSMLCYFLSVKNRSVFGNAHHFIRNLFDVVNFVSWKSKFGTDIVDANFAGNINSSKSFSVWHPDGRIYSDYTSSSSAFLRFYLMKSLYHYLPIAIMVCIRCEVVEDFDHLFLCKHNDAARLNILLNIDVMQSLCKAKSSDDLYMLLAKRFVLKSWVSDTVLCLDPAFGSSLIVKLKHNFLPHDGSAMPSIVGLPELWNADVICNFGFRLSIYMCFGLFPCFARLNFGFLNSILLTVPACA